MPGTKSLHLTMFEHPMGVWGGAASAPQRPMMIVKDGIKGKKLRNFTLR